MSVFDELVRESEPTLTSMPNRQRTDEPWHWEIRMNFNDPDTGKPIDLSDAKASCRLAKAGGDLLSRFSAKCEGNLVVIDASDKQIKKVTAACEEGECAWSLSLELPQPDGRKVQVFGPDPFGIVPELKTFH